MRQNLTAAGVVITSLAVYIVTMPRTITLEDAGLFQMVCHLGGISHPPGYPLFTLMCQPMVATLTSLGFPTIISGNLVSALFASLAVLFFFQCCLLISRSLTFAVLAATTWSFGAVFWSQAIIIEVYSLAALTFMLCAWTLLKFLHTRRTAWWYAAALVFSLGLSNHWPLMVLSAPALVALVSPARDTLMGLLGRPQFWLLTVGCFCLGLSPYLTLFDPDPLISVTGGIHSVQGLLDHVSRSAYTGVPDGTIEDFRGYFDWLAGLTLVQAGLTGLPFMLAGLYFCGQRFGFYLFLSMLLLWMGTTWVLALLVEFQFNHLGKAYFTPYTVIAMAAPAFWFATGMTTLGDLLVNRFNLPRYGTPLVGGALVLILLMQNFPLNNRSQNQLVDSFTRAVLTSLPENAVLFVESDNETGPFGYLHLVEGVRPDIELRSWRNTVFANRLASPFLPIDEREAIIADYIRDARKPVFVIRPSVSPSVDYGAYVQASSSEGLVLEPDLIRWLAFALHVDQQQLVRNAHEQRYLHNRLDGFARLLLTAPDVPETLSELKQQLLETFHGRLIQLEFAVQRQDPRAKELAASLEAAGLPENADPGAHRRFYEAAAASVLQVSGDTAEAGRYLNLALRALPSADNRRVCELADEIPLDVLPSRTCRQ